MKLHFNKIQLILTNPFNAPVHFNALRSVVLNFQRRWPNTPESRHLILMLNVHKFQTNGNNHENNQGAKAPKGRLA